MLLGLFTSISTSYLAWDITDKKCSSNQLIKWSHSDTPTVQVFGVHSHKSKIRSLCMLSWIEQKISKTRTLAFFLWSIVQPLQLNDDRKSKGEQSYRASAVMYTYRSTSWVVALKRPSGSSVKRLLSSHLEKQETKQQCETVYCTHSQRPDWYERSVHYTCMYNIQGAWACRALHVMQTKNLIVTLWCHMAS